MMTDQDDTALVEKVAKAIQQAGLEYKTATGARYTMGTCLANELARAAIAAYREHEAVTRCGECGGAGVVAVEVPHPHSRSHYEDAPCEACSGTGRIATKGRDA